MLLELVWQYNTKLVDSFYLNLLVQQRLHGSTTSCTVWDCHLVRWSKWSVWISSWLSTGNFIEFNSQKIFFFSFSTFDFYGLIYPYTKSVSLWRRQKFHHRSLSKALARLNRFPTNNLSVYFCWVFFFFFFCFCFCFFLFVCLFVCLFVLLFFCFFCFVLVFLTRVIGEDRHSKQINDNYDNDNNNSMINTQTT